MEGVVAFFMGVPLLVLRITLRSEKGCPALEIFSPWSAAQDSFFIENKSFRYNLAHPYLEIGMLRAATQKQSKSSRELDVH